MTLDEGIKHEEELIQRYEKQLKIYESSGEDYSNFFTVQKNIYKLCVEEHRQLAEWLNELKAFKVRKGEWLKMSDEQEYDRYKCSRCGNVVHYKNKMDLYTFNSWCGRCGSDNTNSTPIYGYFMSEKENNE